MKYLKIALLAGGLASVSSFALAQGGGATAGVNYGAVYGSSTTADGSASYARQDQRVHARTVRNATKRQNETTGSGFTSGAGVGSPN